MFGPRVIAAAWGRPWPSAGVHRRDPWTPANVSAEGVGFEPTEAQKTSTVFETVPFVRSGSLPLSRLAVKILERNLRANIHQ
jgi:hypothetical protein